MACTKEYMSYGHTIAITWSVAKQLAMSQWCISVLRGFKSIDNMRNTLLTAASHEFYDP